MSQTMSSKILLQGAIPPELAAALKAFVPTTYADAVALIALGLISVGYLLPSYTWNRPDPYAYIWYERPQQKECATNRVKVTKNIVQRMEELVSIGRKYVNQGEEFG
jgi:NADPH-ferrihemoprotein reductase